MPDEATLTINLRTAEDTSANEPDCRVLIKNERADTIRDVRNLKFPPARDFPGLPPFPLATRLQVTVFPSLYQPSNAFVTLLASGKTIDLPVFREPEKWQPSFAAWKSLPAAFDKLKNSMEQRVLQVKGQPDTPAISADTYDRLAGEPRVLAKAALLNLHTVLSRETDPVSHQKWFDMVREIILIDRERFIAAVDSNLFESIDTIRRHMARYQGFFVGDTSLHNPPRGYQPIPTPNAPIMFSVKSHFENGNIQFTVYRAKGPDGERFVLDCDLDEHAMIVEHLVDVLIHIGTGGTDPRYEHEVIRHHYGNVEMGYTLQPRAAAKTAVG